MSKKFNIVEGPMGYKMLESTARAIEAASKGLPKDFTFKRIGAEPAEFVVDTDSKGDKTDTSMVTTDDVDRDKEVVKPDGLDLDEFRKSPTVFFAHDYTQPVGACNWIKPKSVDGSNGLAAQTRYLKKPSDHEGPWLPTALHSMMQQGVARGKSIGFLPMNRRAATKAELESRPDWKGAHYVTDKGKLLEYSVAPLAANPAAMTLAVSKCFKAGTIDARMADFLAKSMSTALDPSILETKKKGDYSHINMMATPDVAKCMTKGLMQHDAMKQPCAKPEQLAMAKHIATGGPASPMMAKSIAGFWDGPGKDAHQHAEETPMHTLAMLNGGPIGAAWSKGICKSMDDADGGGMTGDDAGGIDSLSMTESGNGGMVTTPDNAVPVDKAATHRNMGAAAEKADGLQDHKDAAAYHKMRMGKALAEGNMPLAAAHRLAMNAHDEAAGVHQAIADGETDKAMDGQNASLAARFASRNAHAMPTKAVESPNGETTVIPPYVPAPNAHPGLPPSDATPDCPNCGTNMAVQNKDDYSGDMDTESMGPGKFVCDSCGSAFDEPTTPTTKAAGKVELNRPGFAHAMSLIAAGKISESPWSFTAADRHAADPEDYLATDSSAAPDTEAHWKYPAVKDGSVYRRGVAAAESRSSAQDLPEIADAAKKLMTAIQAKDAAKKSAAIRLAETTKMVTLADARKAAERAQIELAKKRLPELIRAELAEGLARAAGRV